MRLDLKMVSMLYKKSFFYNFIYRCCFLLVGFFYFGSALQASNLIRLSGEDTFYTLQEKLWYFVPQREISYTEALQNDAWFSPLREKKFLGYHDTSIWIRLRVHNISSQEDWILYANQPQVDEFEFFNVSQNISSLTGDGVLPKESDTFGRFSHFNLHIEKNTTALLYFRLRTPNNFFVDLRLQEPSEFYDYTNTNSFFHGFYLGAFSLLAFFSFALFLTWRKKKYLLYFLFLFAFTFNLFIFHGFAHYFFSLPFISNQLLLVFTFLSAALFLFFFMSLLPLQNYAPHLHSIFSLLALLTFIFSFLSPLMPLSKIDYISLSLFAVIIFLTLLASVRYISKNHAVGISVFFSALFMYMGVLLNVLFYLGILNNNFVLENFSELLIVFGSGFFLYSLVLQDKILQQEKEYNASAELDILRHEKDQQQILLNTYSQQLENAEKISLSISKEISSVNFIREPRIEIEPIFFSMSAPSGDFYEIHQLSPHHYRFFLADTIGMGTHAVLASLAVKSEYQSIKNSHKSLDVLMQNMNQNFMQKFSHLNVFFTCFLLDVDLENNTLKYVSAGHPDQILLQENQARLLKHSGRLMGFSEKLNYQLHVENITSTSRIYLFTKEILEEENEKKEFYGTQKFYQTLYHCLPKKFKESMQLIVQDVKEFKNFKNFSRDITLIGIEVHPHNMF